MKTVLCVPGHDEAKVKKCRQYGADLILFDLEDSVPEGMKDRAREIVAAHITEADSVRVNSDGNSEGDDADLFALHGRRLRHVWYPKATHWYGSWLCKGEGRVMIVETPELLVRLFELVTSTALHGSVKGLAFGAADFAAYMNVPPSSPQVAYARQQVALAAAALGVSAYDSPCTDLSGIETFNETANAMMLGYEWKGAVHPKQIPVIQRASRYQPGDRQLVDQYDQQQEAVILTAAGDVIAPPMIRAARKRLEQQEQESSK